MSSRHEDPSTPLDRRETSSGPAEQVSPEVTLDSIGELVGLYSARIHAEEAKPHPDEQALTELRAERGYWSRLRTRLSVSGPGELERARRRCAELIAQLRGG